jgi:hypothetical protein
MLAAEHIFRIPFLLQSERGAQCAEAATRRNGAALLGTKYCFGQQIVTNRPSTASHLTGFRRGSLPGPASPRWKGSRKLAIFALRWR